MARELSFKITTSADFEQLRGLQNAINGVANAIGELQTNMREFNKAMNNVERNYRAATRATESLAKSNTKLTASVQTATKAQQRYDRIAQEQISLNRRLKSSNDSLTESRERLRKAEQNLAKATKGGNADQIRDAQRAYQLAKGSFDEQVKGAQRLRIELDKLGRERKELEAEARTGRLGALNIYKDLPQELRETSGWIKNIGADFGALHNKVNRTANTFESMKNTAREMDRTMNYRGRADVFADSEAALKSMATEAKRVDQILKESDRAQMQHAKDVAAMQKRNAEVETAQIRAIRTQRVSAMEAVGLAIAEVNRRDVQGIENTQNEWRQFINWRLQQMVNLEAQAREAALTEDQRLDRQMAQMRRLHQVESDMWDDAIRMNKEYDQIQRATSQRETAAAREAQQQIKARQRSVEQLNNTLKQMVRTMSQGFGNFFGGGANQFATFSRNLMTLQQRVTSFSRAVQHGMQAATRAMTGFYNSGWSLITSGYIFQNFGEMLARRVAGGIEDYLQYERVMTRTAIAGQVSPEDAAATGYDVGVNPEYVQEMVFGLQRGDIGGAALTMFDAEELAQGLYYYASAVGQRITPDMYEELGPIMSQMLQLSAATMTEVETATKGVLNIAMEFGIDPRAAMEDIDSVDYQLLEQLPSQLAYLANISTMEIPDVIETFKMVGPMAHILSEESEKAGAGLPETMALTFLASEIGLRGGNVGRGVNQMLTTMLDPTEKALETASEAFGIAASEEAFRAFFFNSEGELDEGLPGLFEKLVGLDDAKLAPLLATLFTTNATRSVVGIAEALKRHSLDRIIADLTSGEATGFLDQAFVATSKTVGAAIGDMQNALFQFKVAIIDSVGDPLKVIFHGIADAFFMMTDIIVDNPWIGQLIAGVLALTAAISSLIGVLFMAGGSLLLTLKAFSIFGGMIGPGILLLSSFATALLVLIPLFALVAGAALFIRNAWVQEDSLLRSIIEGWIERIRGFFEAIGAEGPDKFAEVMETINGIVNEQGNRFMRWGMQNQQVFYDLLQVARDFASGFGTGILAAAVSFTALARELGEALSSVYDYFFAATEVMGPWGRVLFESESRVEQFIESITDLEVESLNLAKIVGGVLGAAFGILIFRHFVPGIVQTIALRGAFIATRVALLAFSAASLVVAGAFKALQIAITAVGMLVSAVSTVWGAAQAFMGTSTATVTTLQIAQTGTTITLTTAQAAQASVTSVLASVLMILAAAYLAIAAALAGVLVGMVVYTAATQGLSAAFDVAAEAAIGVYDGFMLVVRPIAMVVVGIAMLVAKLMDFVNITNHAHAVGVVLGIWLGLIVVAVAALTTALAALGLVITAVVVVAFLQMIAAVIAANLPIIALVAIITLILGVMSELLGFDGVFEMLGSGFKYVADFADWAYNSIKRVAGAVKDLFTNTTQEVLSLEAQNIRSSIESNMADIVGDAAQQRIDLQYLAQSNLSFKDIDPAIEQWYQEEYEASKISREAFVMGRPPTDWDEYFKNARIASDPVLSYQSQRLAEIEGQMANIETKTGEEGVPLVGSYIDEALSAAEGGRPPEWVHGEGEDASKGWWERVEGWFNKFGFDPNDPSGSLMKIMGMGDLGEFTSGVSDMPVAGLSIEQRRYQDDLNQWLAYQQQVYRHAEYLADVAGENFDKLSTEDQDKYLAESAAYVEQYYARLGIQVPLEPVMNDAAANDAVAQMQAMMKEISDGMAKGADLPTALSIAFGGPRGEMTVAGGFAKVGEQILSNIGDAAPWMNMTELLADAAIQGNLGMGIDGQNLQRSLEPILMRTARETGVSMQQLLKDIPKFVAPTELMGMATTELLEALDRLPWQVGDKLDHLGRDVTDRWGNIVAEHGLDFNELATFAASKGMDTDWNLTDYIMVAWDKTRAEAEAYIAANGIDPNIVSGADFEDTQLMAASMQGQISIINDEWAAWLELQTADGDKILELTQRQFDEIPDAIKIGMSNTGYTFHISGQQLRRDIVASGEDIRAGFEEATQLVNMWTGEVITGEQREGFFSRFWADVRADGEVNREHMKTFTDEVTGLTTVWNELTGESFTMPTVEYEKTLQSVRDAEIAADEIDGLHKRLKEARDDFDHLYREEFSMEWLFDIAVDYKINMRGVGEAGFEALDTVQSGGGENIRGQERLEAAQGQVQSDLETKMREYIERMRSQLGYTMSADGITMQAPVELSVTVTDAMVTDVAADFTTNFVAKVDETLSGGEIAFDLTVFSEMGTDAGNAFATAFQAAVNSNYIANFRNQGGSMSEDGQIYGDPVPAGPVAAPQDYSASISVDATAFNTAITNANISLARFESETWTTTLGVNTTDAMGLSGFQGAYNSLQNDWADKTWTTTLGINTADALGLSGFQGAYNSVTGDWEDQTFTTTMDADTATATTNFNVIAKSMNEYNSATPTATMLADILKAGTNITLMNQALTAYDARIVTATVLADILKAGTNISVINQALNAIDGRVVTATVRTVEERVRGYARGGYVTGGNVQLVGEEGPELVSLDRGSYVHNNRDTMSMLNSSDDNYALQSLLRQNSRQLARSEAQNTSAQRVVHIENVHINNDNDGKKFFAQLDRWQGDKVQLATRGMVPTDTATSSA